MLHHRPPRPRCTARTGAVPRRRILALIIGAGGILAIISTGLVLSLLSAVDDSGRATPAPTTHKPITLHDSTPTMTIPVGRTVGRQGVTTGYPHTPEGAVAQLAAIDVALLLQPRSHTERILRAWSLTQPSSSETWTILSAINETPASFADGHIGRALPAMARITSAPAHDRHTVCLVVHGQAAQSLGHCEAMVWDAGHWVMDPAQAPLTSSKVLIAQATSPSTNFRVLQASELW
ncbi:hypothetical protein KIH74_34985 [Kineosporia sp. J2-2]|uniref:DUF8175 domain-containing protein n=1 Tax=Kineosporia corallincola TaxID=2835133 RepID=A0ABS5TTU6_9ACTN|nr:hypothetical protein [Kineosporia corallincola]MBT0774203.1 hypothetical protein [Kineosporia corallincola]